MHQRRAASPETAGKLRESAACCTRGAPRRLHRPEARTVLETHGIEPSVEIVHIHGLHAAHQSRASKIQAPRRSFF
eukprot:1085427-Prymnesium_polylepis.1